MRLIPLVCALLVFVCPLSSAQSTFEVKWANERLTVSAANVPLIDVVREVSRVTGTEVVGIEKLSGLVSAEFTDLPSSQALDRLLTGVSYLTTVRPSTVGSRDQRIVYVQSMAGTGPAGANTSPTAPPVVVAALEALVGEEAETAAEEREEEEADLDLDELRAAEQGRVYELTSKGAFGPDADVATLITLADDGHNRHVRLEALKALGARPMTIALAPLLKALADEAWEVKGAAVEILGGATDRQSLDAVGGLLATDDRDLQLSAMRVIALRGDTRAADHLRAFLKLENVDPEILEVGSQMLAEFEWRLRSKQ